ncbi:MAG: hypothetical protein J6C46_10890 [Clostridia bacterium]|nr:hypothetical protein [Clostridia bacterium]
MNKKLLKLVMLCCFVIITITACTTSKSYTYKVETGDNIKVTLNTSNGYDMTATNPIELSKNGTKVSDGIFITLEMYEQYLDVVENDEKSTIIKTGNANGVEYTFYNYDNKEYNYIMKIKDSNTGFILGTPNSQDGAEESFSMIGLEKE